MKRNRHILNIFNTQFFRQYRIRVRKYTLSLVISGFLQLTVYFEETQTVYTILNQFWNRIYLFCERKQSNLFRVNSLHIFREWRFSQRYEMESTSDIVWNIPALVRWIFFCSFFFWLLFCIIWLSNYTLFIDFNLYMIKKIKLKKMHSLHCIYTYI